MYITLFFLGGGWRGKGPCLGVGSLMKDRFISYENDFTGKMVRC